MLRALQFWGPRGGPALTAPLSIAYEGLSAVAPPLQLISLAGRHSCLRHPLKPRPRQLCIHRPVLCTWRVSNMLMPLRLAVCTHGSSGLNHTWARMNHSWGGRGVLCWNAESRDLGSKPNGSQEALIPSLDYSALKALIL
jgi:hypothetical protein